MRFLWTIGAAMLFASPSPASAGLDANAAIWLADLQHAEEMTAASIRTVDRDEYKKQSMNIARIIGRSEDALSSLTLHDRLTCSGAANALNSVLLDFKLPPAQSLVALRRDSKEFHQSMTKCEKLMGLKRKRHLPRPDQW